MIRLRRSDLPAVGVAFANKRRLERHVAERLSAALARRGMPVKTVAMDLPGLPEVGLSWWSLAALESGETVSVACHLSRPLLRPVIKWRLHR